MLAALVVTQLALKAYTLAGFQVSLPVAPKPLAFQGMPKFVKSWQAITAGGTAFIITFAKDSTDRQTLDRRLANFSEGVIGGMHGKLVGQKDLLSKGWPGLDFAIDAPRGLSWGKAYAFTGSMVAVVGGGTKASKPLVDAVLDSIVIDPKIGEGPSKVAGPIWTRQSLGPSYSVEFPTEAERNDAGDRPEAKRTSWNAVYGNRAYNTFIVSLADDIPALEESMLLSTARDTNSATLQSVKGKLVARHDITLLGKPGERVEAVSPDGEKALFFQAVVFPRGAVIMTAIVPKCLRTSPEVTRFLSSLAYTEPTGSQKNGERVHTTERSARVARTALVVAPRI